jgi:dihydrofolate reductase
MKRLVFFIHTSLDGFVAGPNAEIDWIKVDEELFDYSKIITDQADTAIYGHVTYQMMESYWPSAAEKPAATKHDREHAKWYNSVAKIVVSRTIQQTNSKNTRFIGTNIVEEINNAKQGSGKDILLLGSPTIARMLMQEKLIDDYWLFVNPIILGSGIQLYSGFKNILKIKLVQAKFFSSGVIGLHYEKISVKS